MNLNPAELCALVDVLQWLSRPGAKISVDSSGNVDHVQFSSVTWEILRSLDDKIQNHIREQFLLAESMDFVSADVDNSSESHEDDR